MANYPLSVRKLTKHARLVEANVKADWQSMYDQMQGQERAEAALKHQLCQALSRDFTRAVFENCHFKRQEGAEGITYSVESYALTYDELMMLLYHAYCEGQTERGNLTHLLQDDYDRFAAIAKAEGGEG